jgi:hypothetical protein
MSDPIFSIKDKELLQRKLKVYAELLDTADMPLKNEMMKEMQRLAFQLRSMN